MLRGVVVIAGAARRQGWAWRQQRDQHKPAQIRLESVRAKAAVKCFEADMWQLSFDPMQPRRGKQRLDNMLDEYNSLRCSAGLARDEEVADQPFLALIKEEG